MYDVDATLRIGPIVLRLTATGRYSIARVRRSDHGDSARAFRGEILELSAVPTEREEIDGN